MYSAAVFLPLLGAIVAGLFGRFIGDRGAQIVTCGLLIIAAAASIPILYFVAISEGAANVSVPVLTWIHSGDFQVEWALRYDPLTAVMVFVVTVVSALVHLYSIGYMRGDPGIPRFFSYLSLFTFSMLMLVTADNFVQLFFGWEGVGLCSYLLIGYWYDRPSANAAAIKAFVVNRIGDFGFALGIAGVFLVFDSVRFADVFAAAPAKAGMEWNFLGMQVDALTTIAILLFIGAMGKSAQVGLHTWLPDAMEGPTPVSALIHAATMVTAGVFMVVRLSPLFEYAPTALIVVAVVGATTAFFTATIATTQNDIKRVIAYSTCSQLGYMFFAAGVSAYAAAIFHLMTHAFFKALLFLGSGAVIHAMSDEQDMRKMGGLWRKLPVTYTVMWIGSLALAGIPFFAGYYSKDIIIEAAWASGTAAGQYAFWLGVVGAVLTAFYSWRLIIMTFHGAPRADPEVMAHAHEAPASMTVPLILLAVGATFSGMLGFYLFVGDGMETFWRASVFVLPDHRSIEAAHHVEEWVKILPVAVAVAGIGFAYLAYMVFPGLPALFVRRFRGAYLFLLNKWYFDEIYDRLFVFPAQYVGRGLWKSGDGALIDGVGPDGIAAATQNLARRAGALQTGYVYHYAFAILVGVAGLVTLYLLTVA